MSTTITLFANLTNPTGPELDNTIQTIGVLAPIPCTVAGTNDLTLAQPAGTTPTINAYANYMQLSGVASASNSGAMTARLGSLGILNVYKDTAAGPVALVANELIAGNAFTLVYDSALNAGAGGFHLVSTTAGLGTYLLLSGGTVTGNLNVASLASLNQLRVGATAATITRILSATATVTFSVVAANSYQEQPFTLAGVQINDSIAIGPPSLTAQAIGFCGFVPAAGTVTLRATNPSTATLTPTAGLYRVTAVGAV